MQAINRKEFFDGWRTAFGALRQSQVDGLEILLAALEADGQITDLRHAAYMLATAYHETGHTMQPIAEYNRGIGRPYGIPDRHTGKTYYGRGYVQLTWRENYEAMGRVFGLDLLHDPELAMRPEVAYRIMSHGMRKGSFTGRRLDMYIGGDRCDYVAARRIINGIDCADRIADYARWIETMLISA